jgi:hypothetical protein
VAPTACCALYVSGRGSWEQKHVLVRFWRIDNLKCHFAADALTYG